MVREKYLDNEFFSRSGKSQGIGRQTSENLFFSGGEKMYFLMR